VNGLWKGGREGAAAGKEDPSHPNYPMHRRQVQSRERETPKKNTKEDRDSRRNFRLATTRHALSSGWSTKQSLPKTESVEVQKREMHGRSRHKDSPRRTGMPGEINFKTTG